MAIFGFDVHPGYQPGFDFARAADQDYKFGLVKASQGVNYVPAGLGKYYARLEGNIEVPGLYHFLEGGPSGSDQAKLFVEVVRDLGGSEGKLCAVDFEPYAGGDPSNAQLASFVRRFKDLTDGHPLIVYSMTSFWNSGIPSGDFDQYAADAAWDARVWYAEEQRTTPKFFYRNQWLPWYEDQRPRGLGGHDPEFLQFTWGGLVGGLYVDTDAYRGSVEDLKKLTRR